MKAKRKLIQSVLSAGLALCLMLSLCACGAKNEGAKTTDAPTDTTPPEFVYAAEHKSLPESGEQKNSVPLCLTEDGFYLSYFVKVGENIPEGKTPEYEGQYDVEEPRIAFCDYEGSVKPLENYAPVQPEQPGEGKRDFAASASVEALLLSDEGALVVLENLYCSWSDAPEDIKADNPEYMNYYCSDIAYYVRTLDRTGNELSRAKLEVNTDNYLQTYGAQLDNAGNLVIVSDSSIYGFSLDGQPVYDLDFGGYVFSLTRLRDGRVGALGYDSGYSFQLKIVDGEAKSFDSKRCAVPDMVYELIPGSGEYDTYYTDGSSFCGYRLDDEAAETLFDWTSCDINTSQLYRMIACEDGVFRGIAGRGEDREIFSVSKVPADSVPQREHLRMAVMYLDDNVQRAVINFNRANDKYRIDIVDYSQYNSREDYSSGLTKLSTEIMAGNMPDILSLDMELPYRQLAAKGLLEDLKPYIEADAALDLDDFFPNVISAMEVDGKLCAACAGFMVQTVAGAASVVGDTPGWTYEDYFAALEKMPEGCEGFDFGVDRNNMLMVALALDLADYVNWSTGECRFDSEDFIKLLNYAASFPDAPDSNYQYSADDSNAARITSGRQMLSTVSFSGTDFMVEDYNELFGGEATYIGFPTNHGVGSVIAMGDSYAMSSSCKNKEVAWEFLRVFLTEDYQEQSYYLPTNKKAFETSLAKAMETEYEQDANGNYLLDENGERIPVSRGGYSDGINYYEIYATTPEQARQLREVIATAEKLVDYDISIIDIVTEQAAAFFAGQKSAEDVAKLIQSKVNIYVNEQR